MITRTKPEWVEILNIMPAEGPGIRGDSFLYSAQSDWDKYKKYINLKAGDTIVDIGCGHGRMAVNFINSNINYLGIDILPEAIQWAVAAFAPWNNIEFYYDNLYNSMYHPKGASANNFKILMPASGVKGVLALSLFTHLETLDVVEHYLMEVRRVLCNDGAVIATFFVAPPNDCSGDAKRSVFDILDINILLVKCKFKIQEQWGGMTRAWHDQTIVVLRPI